jgi:hypothetical protein
MVSVKQDAYEVGYIFPHFCLLLVPFKLVTAWIYVVPFSLFLNGQIHYISKANSDTENLERIKSNKHKNLARNHMNMF